ncbi:MAG: Glu/Leu/Phe/Val dehydrogenase [Alphaproteobacteria bacterium]
MTFSFIDDLGPEKLIELYDPRAGLKAILVVDNTAAGPSIGGVRMAPDVSAEECFRLARAMSFKNAAAGLAHGGGKSVIFADPAMATQDKEKLIRAFARAIAEIEDYISGPDMGTNEIAMAWVKDEIGRAAGLPREIGGIPLDEIGATGYGLAAAAEVAQNYCGLKLSRARIAIQGFGSVGIHAARFLAEKGAVIVGVSDSRGTISNPDGLDLPAIIRLKREGKRVAEFSGGIKGQVDAIIGVKCDIWIPAARPDVVTMKNVDRLSAKLILEGANIPIELEAEKALHKRGVMIVPDFIANAGGVICAAVEYARGTEAQALAVIGEKIAANTEEVLSSAKRGAITPREAAIAMAKTRIQRAMSYRGS